MLPLWLEPILRPSILAGLASFAMIPDPVITDLLSLAGEAKIRAVLQEVAARDGIVTDVAFPHWIGTNPTGQVGVFLCFSHRSQAEAVRF